MVTYPLERRILAGLIWNSTDDNEYPHLHEIFLIISVIKPLLSSPESQSTPSPQPLITQTDAAVSGKRKMDLWYSTSLHTLQLVSKQTHNCVYQEVFLF